MQDLQNSKKENPGRRYITYQNMFWLFMIGNVIGFVMEGFWCLFKYGGWESHVVTIWGPFCMIYGVGAVVLYVGTVLLRNQNIFVKFFAVAIIASVVELLCGLLLEFGMGMRAWNYSRHFLNIRGHISLKMTVMWGVIGIIFAYLIVRPLELFFEMISGKTAKTLCAVLSVFMVINMTATLACMVRWKQRHDGTDANTKIGKTIDRIYPDERMADRFIEWYFMEDVQRDTDEN